MEINNLVTAIRNYHAAYGRFPCSKKGEVANRESNGSYTYGWQPAPTMAATEPGNTDLMAIITASARLPDGSSVAANADNARNPRKTRFIELRMASDNKSPGLGLDGNYRDPWGNPYVITLDLDGDGYCVDPIYSRPAVTRMPVRLPRHIDGTVRTNKSGLVQFPVGVMIWSRGPDGKADPKIPADEGVNLDNILSWQ